MPYTSRRTSRDHRKETNLLSQFQTAPVRDSGLVAAVEQRQPFEVVLAGRKQDCLCLPLGRFDSDYMVAAGQTGPVLVAPSTPSLFSPFYVSLKCKDRDLVDSS